MHDCLFALSQRFTQGLSFLCKEVFLFVQSGPGFTNIPFSLLMCKPGTDYIVEALPQILAWLSNQAITHFRIW